MKLTDIVYEQDGYTVTRASYGFDIYRSEATAMVRCARIGYTGDKGLQRAKQEITRRLETK